MALLFCNELHTQTSGLGTWSIISTKYQVSNQYFFLFETQIRSQQIYNNFNYYESKAGMGYNFPKNGSVLIAAGHYTTYQPDGNFKNPTTGNEFRIWEQFILNNNINRLKLEHRYRLEQRFTASGYRNRFRYRLNAIYPINNSSIKQKTWYLSVYNEFFLNNDGVYFEQNRMFAGIGYQINNRLTAQGGFINRFDNLDTNNKISKNFFQTILLFSLNEFKSDRERHPSAVD